MLIANLHLILGVVLGSLCIQTSVGRGLPPPAWGPTPYTSFPPQKPLLGLGIGADANLYTGLDAGFGFSADVSVFSDVLFNLLLDSNVFGSRILAQINADVAISIGVALAQSLAIEIGLGDTYTATNLLTNALISIGPGAPSEAYCRVLAKTVGQIMLNNGILNSTNSVTLAKTLSRIIIRAISPSLYGDVGLGLGIGLGTGIDLNTGLRLDDSTILGAKANLNGGLGVNAGLGVDAGLGLGLGLGAGLGVDAGFGLGGGLGANLGLGAAADLGVGANLGLGAATGLGVGANAGLGASAGLGVGANLGLGIGADVGLGIGANVGLGLGSGINAGVNLGLGAGGTDLQVGLGADLDLSVSADSVGVFKSELRKELLKDNYFRYVFSDYVPSSVSKLITAAITQCLSKAFSIPRSTLLPLENIIINSPADVASSPETYAQNIVDSLLQCLVPLNLITVASAKLQASIAAKATISGITNFLAISSIPGIGLSVNSNSYNSYFSALSGLEKLPYVGIDVVSSKLPPIVTTAKSSANALQFSKILLNNLLSSNKFSEAFQLGIPVFTYKSISNALGKSVAEAFGSPFSSLFSKIFTNFLFAVDNKLNYQTYARALSEATMNALYLLGYFSSGNVNIQAAIANNAIIRTLVKQLKATDSPDNLFPSVMGLPWSTPIKGVAPPESLLKLGIGAKVGSGLGVDLGLGLGLDAGLGLGVNADLGVGVGTDLDLGVKAGLGLGVDADVGAKVGLGVNPGRRTRQKRAGDDLFKDLDTDELDLAVDAVLKGAVNVGLGVGADLNAGVGLGANVGLGVDAGVGVGLGLKPGLKVGAGANEDGTKNSQLSILAVLPPILANKLYKSTALYTATAITGSRKVVTLIAQAMAVEFGSPIAALFLKSFEKYIGSSSDADFGPNVIALSLATSEALAGSGILNSQFTVQAVDQLSTAIVDKYSSLIATSLDSKVPVLSSKWTYLFGQEQLQPPLAPGYYLK